MSKLKNINKKIISTPIEDEMKSSYLDYAMSVIIGRALPDVRDGLKPVHRRVLYAMLERHWTHDKAFVKSAKIVGEVIGNYHPHGDTAAYETMVRMVQDFSLNVPLVTGQGNFGSIDGDKAAAYRYTEAKLSSPAEELLKDIRKETVDFVPNFDGTKPEPVVLPAAFPNLLVNGSNGIAVGMATNIPPHNLTEVINGTIAFIDNPSIKIIDLMKYIKGPDFPTAGLIFGAKGIKEAYLTGKGKITLRANIEFENTKTGKERIIVTEIPYQVNKANLIESIAHLVKDKKIEGISLLRDESDRSGMRIVIEIKKNMNSQIILNQLYKHTQLQVGFGIILLALVDNQPKVLNIKEILNEYVKHRKEIVVRRTKYDLKKAEARAHILEGLIIALNNIDAVIKVIKSSKTVDVARKNLMTQFKLSEIQANAILDMKLQRLTALEVDKLKKEYAELKKIIAELKAILASEKKILDIVKKELIGLRDKYKTERKTKIVMDSVESFAIEDILADEDMVITISNAGYIKRLPIDTYKRQRRGGRGVSSANMRKEDFVSLISIASTHSYLLFFTNKGKIFWVRVHEIQQESKQSKGRPIGSILNISANEKITAIVSVKDFSNDSSLVMITKNGIIKKTKTSEFSNAKKKGIVSIHLLSKDELVDVKLVEKKQDGFIGTKYGKGLRFNLDKIRNMGRSAKGVKALTLSKDDEIIGMTVVLPKTKLFVVTELGFGKRVDYKNFKAKGRGGKGMTYVKTSDKTGGTVGIKSIGDDEELMLISEQGIMIRFQAKTISSQGRSTHGIKVMSLEKQDKVSDIAIVTEVTL